MLSQRRNSKALLAAAILTAACAATTAQAAWTGDWTNTTYTNTANWAGGTIDDTFSANLLANRTAYFPEAGAIDYTTSSNGFVFSYADSFGLTLLPDTVSARDIRLGGNIMVDVAGTTANTVTMGSASRTLNLNLGGVARTINMPSTGSVQWSNTDVLSLYGNISNGTLTKDGFGTLILNNAVSLNTDLNFKKGTISLVGNGSLQSIASLQYQSMWARTIADQGTTNNARVADTAPVVFRSGAYMQRNTTANPYNENLGDVTLESGKSYIGIDSGVSTGATTLSLKSLTRQNSAMLSVGGNATLGSTNKVIVTDAASNTMLTNSLVGGGGAAGTTNVSIIPWASFSVAASGTQDSSWYSINKTSATGVGGFVTYDSVNGFRPLNVTAEYAGTLAAANATDNVRLTAAETLSSSKTINALWGDVAASTTLTLGTNTLTVTSGAVGVTASTFAIGASANAGTLAFGNKTGYFTGRSTITVNAAITGSAGIVAGGPVTLNLNGTNTYTGDTIIYTGAKVTTAGGVGRLGNNSRILIGNEANLAIGDSTRRDETAAALGGRGTLYWNNATKSSLRLGTGAVATQGAVTVGSTGYIAPGDLDGSTQAGTLTLGTGASSVNAIFENGSSLKIDIAGATQSDLLAVANGSATINGGSLELNLLNGYIPQVGDTFNVLTATGGITGSFALVNNTGYSFQQNIVGGNTLQLSVLAIPEPATVGLLGLATSLALLRRNAK